MSWLTLALLSALFSTISTLSEKKVLFKLEALDFSFILSLFNLVFTVPFFLSINFNAIDPVNLTILFFKTLLEACAYWSVMLALKNLEISRALPLLALTPGLIAIFAYLFIGDELSGMETGGIALLVCGTYLLESKKGQKIYEPFKILFTSKKHVYILIALVIFTITSILDRTLLVKYKLPPQAFISFQHLYLAVIFSVIFFFRKKKELFITLSENRSLWLWVILISVLTISYRYSQIQAVKLAPVALVISVKRLSIFFASVAGGKIFKEDKLLLKAIAAALIIGGTLLFAGS